MDPRELRNALGRFPTGVSVIATRDGAGALAGFTANSVTMLGADPPRLLWSLGKHSRSRAAFEECEFFVVNVLGEQQAGLAKQMAGPGDRFAGVDWQPGGSAGLPVFDGAVAWFECRRSAVFEAGDHVSLIGDIVHHRRGSGAPLLYAGGQFLAGSTDPRDLLGGLANHMDQDLALEVRQAGDDPDLAREHWNPRQETMPQAQMRELQTAKLKRQLAYLEKNSALYQRKFKECGFDPAALRSIEDLAHLPFTTKSDLREGQETHAPFGLHQAAPMESIVRVTSTAGTTGRPVFQGYAREDVMRRNESVARGLWGFGVRPGDRVINGFALSMFNAGIPFCTGIEHLGAIDIPVGAERKAEGMLMIARELKATVWIGTPSFAGFLAEKCEEVLGIKPDQLGLRVVCGGGESGFEQPAFQKKMEQAFGTPHVYDWASTSDAHPNVFAHCRQRQGKHHLTPDFALVELIDPASGKILAMEDGAEGEYIFTHLDRRACPLARYRTGDILRVRTSPCECGRSGFRMDIVGRSDDMLIIRGVNLFPSAIQSVVGGFAPKTTGRMQILLDRPGPKAEPPLRVRIEHAASLGAGECEDLKGAIEQAIRSRLTVTAAVELVPPGGVARTETKTRLVVVEGTK